MNSHPIPDAALAQHVAVVGKTGAGKSYAAKGIVERLLGLGRRVCVIDPTSAWWGLRSSADGARPGFPVAVFGGEHADVAIAPGSGAALAAIVAGHNLPCVIDLSEMLIGARHAFVEDFAAEIYRLNRTPLHLVIDEADEFAPQNPLPETRRMLHQIDRIVRRGRIRGFRVIMITQRPAVLHKNVLTQANTLIAMRLTAPQDRKAIEAWVQGQADPKQGRDVLDSLPRLQRGEGWVWSPEHGLLEKTRFPRIATFDSGRTPDDGEAVAEPTHLASVDLSEIRTALQDAEAEAAANDPAALKKQIAELTKRLDLASRHPAPVTTDPKMIADAERRGAARALATVTDTLRTSIMPMLAQIRETAALADRFTASFETFLASLAAAGPAASSTMEATGTTTPEQAHRAARAHLGRARSFSVPGTYGTGPGETMPRAERRILTALAQYPDGRTKTQVAVLTGYAVTGGGFLNALGALRTKGWIEGRDALQATAAGIAALGTFEPLPHGDALLQHWRGQLGKAERSILDALTFRYPGTMTRDELAARAGYAADGGGFNNAIGRLRTLELIGGDRAALRASDDLFG